MFRSPNSGFLINFDLRSEANFLLVPVDRTLDNVNILLPAYWRKACSSCVL